MNTINQQPIHMQEQGGLWLASLACACACPVGGFSNDSEVVGKTYIKFDNMKT
jgi:hypothetical protein